MSRPPLARDSSPQLGIHSGRARGSVGPRTRAVLRKRFWLRSRSDTGTTSARFAPWARAPVGSLLQGALLRGLQTADCSTCSRPSPRVGGRGTDQSVVWKRLSVGFAYRKSGEQPSALSDQLIQRSFGATVLLVQSADR